jgi:hypothetical protein
VGKRAWSHSCPVKPVTDASGELEYLAYYLFKPPYDVKMLEKRLRGERLKSTEKGYNQSSPLAFSSCCASSI